MADLNSDTAAAEPLPLDAWHRAQGGRMVPFAGYAMPVQYQGIVAEHQATREDAGLFDVSHMGQLLVSGDGATAALEALLPGDLAALRPARMRYSLLLDRDGGILDDLMATRLPDAHPFGPGEREAFYIVVNGATKADDIAFLHRHLPPGVQLSHLTDRALLALQGPRAGEVMGALVPDSAQLYFMQAGGARWQGHDLWISRSGYTGEDGFEVSLPAAAAAEFADALVAAGALPAGLGARDSLRLEAGLPLYGHDLHPGVSPVAADLGFALGKRRREQGGFNGAERIARELAEGTASRRVGLTVEGKLPVREGAPLFAGGREVGAVTSGGFAPSLGAPIAMAYVAAEAAAPGTRLEAEVRGRRVPVTVAPMPFVPHRYRRPPKAAQGGSA